MSPPDAARPAAASGPEHDRQANRSGANTIASERRSELATDLKRAAENLREAMSPAHARALPSAVADQCEVDLRLPPPVDFVCALAQALDMVQRRQRGEFDAVITGLIEGRRSRRRER